MDSFSKIRLITKESYYNSLHKISSQKKINYNKYQGILNGTENIKIFDLVDTPSIYFSIDNIVFIYIRIEINDIGDIKYLTLIPDVYERNTDEIFLTIKNSTIDLDNWKLSYIDDKNLYIKNVINREPCGYFGLSESKLSNYGYSYGNYEAIDTISGEKIKFSLIERENYFLKEPVIVFPEKENLNISNKILDIRLSFILTLLCNNNDNRGNNKKVDI